MPVRIYDIAKKLGLENKEVLSKAKGLGISAAKVASSSLDKITAEYLEGELLKEHPEIASPAPPPPPPPAPVPQEPIKVVTAPPEPPPAPSAIPAEPPLTESTPTEASETAAAPADVKPSITEPATPSPEPEEPKGPKLGEKVGFIQLPTRPRVEERGRGREKEKERDRKPDRPAVPGARPAAPGRGPEPAAKPASPKVSLPSDAPVITMKAPIVVRDLAEQLKQKPFKLIADLMGMGVFANVNQAIEEPIAARVCAIYGVKFELEKRERGGGVVHAPVKKVELDVDDKQEDLKPRPPVVTIMGHVDHGKTTLLDRIRKANVAAGEAGGITQHIGAYTIAFPHPERPQDLQQITFLDTPGHEAFSAMRARGANVTDIVVLVVAANDGVMPQTLEALNHAKAAEAEIMVAVNKCDHPNANPLRVRQQLQEHGLVCEEWGGTTLFVDASGLTGTGVDKLLEAILLQAEIMELKANPNRKAVGNVIESGVEAGGPTATVLVRKGTLRVGDAIICGSHWGKVRALINEEGRRLKEAPPSVAVRVLGLDGAPDAGAEFNVVENEKVARELAAERALKEKAEQAAELKPRVTLENLFATIQETQSKVLKVVVKADTQGSVEAIVDAVKKIPADKVALEVIHHAVGAISEYDVLLASASKAVVLGFHTRLDTKAAEVAKREGVQVKLYAIIYELVDEVRDAMAGLLDPILREVVLGAAEVRQVFALSKGGNVAGCAVTQGRVARGKVRIVRRKNVIFEGVTLSLRRFQDEVNEVRSGMECGIRIDGFDQFQPGDMIECYSVEKVAQKL
jgi:translation initiation factor IF-2